jgi:hypothetical protein
MLFRLLLVCMVAFARAGASGDVSFYVQPPVGTDAPLVWLHAGHPIKDLPLQLVVGTPLPDFRAAMADATAYDLPGQYAAVVIPPSDPLVRAELSGPSDAGLLFAPRLVATTRGQVLTLPVNTSAAAAASGLLTNRAARGLFILGPGSSVWLQWRYALLGPDALTLTNEEAVVDWPTTPLRLACQAYDTLGRCTLPGQVVLDFERSTSVLPDDAYAALLTGDRHAVQTLLGGHVVTLATRAHVSSGQPEFVVASTADAGTATVLGRRTLTRLFGGTLLFDSATHTWTATLAAADQPATQDSRLYVLAVASVALSLLLLARFYVSTGNVRLRYAMATLFSTNRMYTPALDRVQLVVVHLSLVFVLAGSWTGYVCLVDTPEPGRALLEPATLAAAVGATVFALLVDAVIFGLNGPPAALWAHLAAANAMSDDAAAAGGGGTGSAAARQLAALTDVAVGGLHASSCTLALFATLAPMVHTDGEWASLVGHTVVALVTVLFVLAALTYHAVALAVLVLALSSVTGWRRAGFGVVALALLGALVTAAVGAQRWVLAPLIARSNSTYPTQVPPLAGTIAVTGMCALALFLIVAELAGVLREQTQKMTTKKSV